MNIAYFLLPKNSVAYLYDDCTFRQGLEKMRHHGYTAIPVISRDGKYVGHRQRGRLPLAAPLQGIRHTDRLLHEGHGTTGDPGHPPGQQLSLRPHHRHHGGAAPERHEPELIPVVDDLGRLSASSPERTSSAISRNRRTRRSVRPCGRSYEQRDEELGIRH